MQKRSSEMCCSTPKSQQHSISSTNRRITSFDGTSDLPLYEITSSSKHSFKPPLMKNSRFSEKWIHLIPLLVFLCIFILWWFSYPVKLEMKNGRIVSVHPNLDIPFVRMTSLLASSSSISPNSRISQVLMANTDNVPAQFMNQ